ncbi:MAG: LPS assembly protein LptD [Deltaproteobacteria bacterium]|nr:LPS assembly protein LptD [Deltaproteobacteria bacterium]
MKKFGVHFIAAFLLVFWSAGSALAENRVIYTVQACSSTSEGKIVRAARMLETSEKDGVRVEKINGLYTLRAGRYAKNGEGIACLGRARKVYPGAILRRAYDMPERIVYAGNAIPEMPENVAPLEAPGKTIPEMPENAAPSEAPLRKAAVVQDPVGSEKMRSESGPVSAGGETTTVFRGVVHDGEGKPVRDATVEIIGISLAPVKTGDDGGFTISGLPPFKVFSLKIVREGYDTIRTPIIDVSSDIKGEPERYTMRPLSPAALAAMPREGLSPAPASPPDPKPPPAGPESLLPEPDTPPATGAVDIEADSISYSRDEDTYHARGNVVITYEGSVLTADSVVMNKGTNDALAEGAVTVWSDNDILEGERVAFNIATKMGVAYQGKVFLAQNHFYLQGKKIEKKGEATYRVYDALATTCDGDSPDWQLKGSELNVTVDGYGTLKDGTLLAKNLPVLYTPYLFFPAKTTRQSGLLYPRLSYSKDKSGWDTELPFYWAISKSSDATFYQRYMDKRGFKEGVEFRYFISKDSSGTFYGDYMNDTGRFTGPTLNRDWKVGQRRWSLYWNHETTFSPTSYVRTDIMKVSDPWYFRDFDSYNYYLDNYSKEERRFKKISFQANESLAGTDSTVRFVKNWPLYNLTGLVKYSDDFNNVTNDATLQRYPEITLAGIKRPIMDTGYNLEFAAAYDYFYRVKGQKGHFTDVQPILSYPYNVVPYFQVIPEIALRETYWSRDDKTSDDNRQGDRSMYRLGLNLNTEVHRIFIIGGERLDKIRHGIKPELTYTYIPNINQTDMPNYVGAVAEQNTLTYALTNTFIARLKEKGGMASYREFLRLKLAQTYNIRESRRTVVAPDPDRRPFGDVDMEADFLPFSYLSFAARHKFNVNSGHWKQTNYDVSVSDVRGDAATLGYRYTQFSLEEVNLSLNAALTRSLDAIYILRRNEFDHITLEKTYGFKYRKQCWKVEATYSEKENDRIWMVLISLYGLGQFGQEIWKDTIPPPRN